MNDRTNQYPPKDDEYTRAISDPRDAQLLAMFRKSDDRGKDLLLQIAGIHAARYPKKV